MKISRSPIETTMPKMVVDSAAAAAVRRSTTTRRTTAAGARCTRTTARASGTALTTSMRKRMTPRLVSVAPLRQTRTRMKKILSSAVAVVVPERAQAHPGARAVVAPERLVARALAAGRRRVSSHPVAPAARVSAVAR
jgi:hypothetical protein